MLPPDISYFLDCALQSCHITGDTEHFHRSFQTNVVELIDKFEDQRDYPKHWNRLVDMGLALEHDYIYHRGHMTPVERQACSLNALKNMRFQLHEFVGSYSNLLADNNFSRLTPDAFVKMNECYAFADNVGILSRAATRAWHDLNDCSMDDLRSIKAADVKRIASLINLTTANRYILSADEDYLDSNDFTMENCRFLLNEQDYLDPSVLKQRKLKRIKERKEQRKIIKRSIKFAQKFLGTETTRLFLNRNVIRIDGENVIFEIVKSTSNSATTSHGGSTLRIFDKKNPSIYLGNICIYSKDVPLLDHVCSLIMHVKAGLEDEIMEKGNLYNLSDDALEHEYVSRFLRKREVIDLGELGDIDFIVTETRENPFKVSKKRKKLMKSLHDDLYRFIYENILSEVRPLYNAVYEIDRPLIETRRVYL